MTVEPASIVDDGIKTKNFRFQRIYYKNADIITQIFCRLPYSGFICQRLLTQYITIN